MTRAAEVIADALGLLRVVSATEAPEAEDAERAIRSLNSMLAAWAEDGWDLGWTVVSNPADALTSPAWADEALAYNLAVRLRPHYGVTLDPDVFAMAESGKATMSAFIARKVEAEEKPRCKYDDLPRGVGRNSGDFFQG